LPHDAYDTATQGDELKPCPRLRRPRPLHPDPVPVRVAGRTRPDKPADPAATTPVV